MLQVVLFATAALAVASIFSLAKNRRSDVMKYAAAFFSASLLAGMSFVPSAGAATSAQKPLKISNTVVTATVGTSITVKTTGGSGTGAVSFSVSGANCTIGAKSGVLSASAAASCSVKATKAASKGYKAATSSAVTFTFTAAQSSSGGSSTGTSTGTGTSGSSTGTGNDSPTPSAPDVATLTSVAGAASAQINDTVNGDNYFIDQYYNANDHWYIYYIAPGATITQTWHVNGSNGKPLANAAVTLIGNAAYSCAPGVQWTTSSLNVNPGCNGGAQGTLAGVTDANGNVSFTLTDKDAAPTAAPSDTTTANGVTTNEASGSPYPWTDMFLQVGSDTFTASPNTTVNQAVDRVDFIVAPAASTPVTNGTVVPTPAAATDHALGISPTWSSPDTAQLTSVTGVIGSTLDGTADGNGGGSGWIPEYYHPGDRWLLNYVAPNAAVTMSWYVTGADGQPLPNTQVTLLSNFNCSNANGILWSTSALNANAGCNTGRSAGTQTATTNSNGSVTFSFSNINTSANQCAQSANPVTVENSELGGCDVGTFVLQIGSDVLTQSTNPHNPSGVYGYGADSTQVTDRVDFLLSPPAGFPVPVGPTNARPDVATLISMSGTTGGQVNDTVNGDNYFIWQYFNPNDHWYEDYIPAGSTVTLTYHVAGPNGSPLVGAPVSLQGVYGNGPAGFTGSLTATTGVDGNATFTLTNTDTAPTGVSPAATPSGAETAEGTFPWSGWWLQVGTDTYTAGDTSTIVQQTDRVDLIVAPSGTTSIPSSPASNGTPEVAQLTSVSGTAASQINDTPNGDTYFIHTYFNWSDRWFVNYIHAGSTVTLTYHASMANGLPYAGATVTLVPVYGNGSAGFTGSLSGQTDAYGNVTFTLTSTDTAPTGTDPTVSADSVGSAETALPWSGWWAQIGNDVYTNSNGSLITQQTDRLDLVVIP